MSQLTVDQKRTVIEQTLARIVQPGAYNFWESGTPRSEEEQGFCLLGWMQFYAERINPQFEGRAFLEGIAEEMMPAPAGEEHHNPERAFYCALERVQEELRKDGTLAAYPFDPSSRGPNRDHNRNTWEYNPQVAAIVLRSWYWSHPEYSPSWITDRGPVDTDQPVL
jgi:hypothetical protein